jgi:hypothetical protein
VLPHAVLPVSRKHAFDNLCLGKTSKAALVVGAVFCVQKMGDGKVTIAKLEAAESRGEAQNSNHLESLVSNADWPS